MTASIEREAVSPSAYWSPDLAPTRPEERTWRLVDFMALWVAMAACIPTYTLASSLIAGGMNWEQSVLTVFLANLIVLIPLILNAHAGTKYGISFPVYCRASFGVLGANLPALLRALVACGWFGIQCWIGGETIYVVLAIYFPSLANMPKNLFGLNAAQLGCFLLFWSLNVVVVWRGVESIRLLMKFKAPLLIAMGLLLLGWALWTAGGFGPILSRPSKFGPGAEKSGQFWSFFFPALTANVGFWATLSLNIPDFSRYARSQRDQVLGQALGLPTTMALYAFIGVAVTSATALIYGAEEWDPVKLLTRFHNPWLLLAGAFAVCLSTLATNLAANAVSPANDFAHLMPRRISFRIGGLITAVIAVLIQPWRLHSDPHGYIYKWLIGYSSLLGAIGGILIADYYFIRRMLLDPAALYRKDGPYWYVNGFNPIGLIALVLGIAPCIPGFLDTVELIHTSERWTRLYHYAWFVSFAVSAASYAILTLIIPSPLKASAPHAKSPEGVPRTQL
jgi:NCS1 family nucleobase:cation symporter-1